MKAEQLFQKFYALFWIIWKDYSAFIYSIVTAIGKQTLEKKDHNTPL